MALKRNTNKRYFKLISKSFILAPQKSKFGIVYTLYSDRFNLIEVGFAENDNVLQKKVLQSDSILLDKKRGKEQEKRRVTHMRLLKDLSGIQLEVKMARSENGAVNVPTINLDGYYAYHIL